MSGRLESSELPQRVFAGISVVAAPPDAIMEALTSEVQAGTSGGQVVHLLTTHSIAEAHRNTDFRTALDNSSWVIADGRWLQFLTSRSSEPLYQLRGQDLLLRFGKVMQREDIRHYFLLSRDSLIQPLEQALTERGWTGQICGSVGFPHGALRTGQRGSIAQNIIDANADVVWFGISTPRQNVEAQWIAESTGVMVICVGAALEFTAGEKLVAPRWVQFLGAEWIFRLLTEPRRLTRRYLIDSLDILKIFLARKASRQK